MKRKRGITLIELLVVVTIIGLFASIVVAKLMPKVGPAKQVVAREQINELETALSAYKLDTGRYPSTEQGLQALRTKPEGVEHWDGAYLHKEVPVDPWRHPYVYKYPGDHGDEPDIMSYGADGKEGGEKEDADICSWKNQ